MRPDGSGNVGLTGVGSAAAGKGTLPLLVVVGIATGDAAIRLNVTKYEAARTWNFMLMLMKYVIGVRLWCRGRRCLTAFVALSVGLC